MFNPLRGRGRDRLSEIIQNPIRKVENPERARTRERFSEPTTSPSPSPHSEMKRKRDACNQADVDTEFRRGVPPLPPPPPSIPEQGWKVSNMTRREQISRVLATPPVTTSQHHHEGCFHGAVDSDLAWRQLAWILETGAVLFPFFRLLPPPPSLFHATSHFSRLFNAETRLVEGIWFHGNCVVYQLVGSRRDFVIWKIGELYLDGGGGGGWERCFHFFLFLFPQQWNTSFS